MFAPPSSIIYHFIIIIFTCTFKWATVRVALIKKGLLLNRMEIKVWKGVMVEKRDEKGTS